MKSNTAEVRALVQALGSKIQRAELTEPLDAQAIGAALYGRIVITVIVHILLANMLFIKRSLLNNH